MDEALRGGRRRFSTFLPLLSLLAMLCGMCWMRQEAAAADAPQFAYRRWAVVSAGEAQSAGIGDLLAARLSQAHGFDLVERDALQKAIQELEINAALGDVKDRLRLGKLVGADAIVLVSIDGPDKHQSLRAVVCECRQGARLGTEAVPLTQDHLEDAVHEMAAKIAALRKKFAAGVQQILAVPPFVSKNLTHNYDDLQIGYARLLESALSALPGAAVIEIEESHAIRRELELTDAALDDRRVPFFVEGQFAVTPAAGDNDPEVTIEIRVSGLPGASRTIAPAKAKLSDVPQLLFGRVARDVARQLSAGLPPLTADGQFAALGQRARVFAMLGDWHRSVELREAALLLKPDDFEETCRVTVEYAYGIDIVPRPFSGQPAGVQPPAAEPPTPDTAVRLEQQRLARWRRMAGHIERLIRRRAVNPAEASALMALPFARRVAFFVDPEMWAEKKRTLQRLIRLYADFDRLDYGLNQGRIRPQLRYHWFEQPEAAEPAVDPAQQYDAWLGGALDSALMLADMESEPVPGEDPLTGRWQIKIDNEKLYELLAWLLTEVARPDGRPVTKIDDLIVNERTSLAVMVKGGKLTAPRVEKFYGLLQQTHQPLNEYYARCGRIALQVWAKPPEDYTSKTLAEVDSLMTFCEDSGYKDPPIGWSGHSPIFGSLWRMRAHVVKNLPEVNKQELGPAPTVKWHHALHPFLNGVAEPYDPQPRVTFAAIDGLQADWTDWIQCHDALDLMWSPTKVFAMSEKGVAREIFSIQDSPEAIQSVHWDGENVWIALGQSGVRIVSPAGELLGVVDGTAGLPPYAAALDARLRMRNSPTLLLYPIKPGKCLAIGDYGTHRRVWFACIEKPPEAQKDTKFSARVFFTATKLSNTSASDTDLEQIFTVCWLLEYNDPRRRLPRSLLVGRRLWAQDPHGNKVQYVPLAIDLETLRVSVFPGHFEPQGRYPDFYRTDPAGKDFAVRGSQILLARPDGCLEEFAPAGDSLSGNWPGQYLTEPREADRHRWGFVQHVPRFLRLGDGWYSPGRNWYRIAGDHGPCEVLTRIPLDEGLSFANYAVSAHYGLVAWNDALLQYTGGFGWSKLGDVVQVRFDAGPQDPRVSHGWVPADRRDKHIRAEDEIRRLGGSVKSAKTGWPGGPVVTTVTLTSDWRGDDDAMALLADLHALARVSLIQARVGDRGLKQLAAAVDLTSLTLSETQITDAGLAALSGLKQLRSVWLEGTLSGNEFGDAGLAHLQNCENLMGLTLYGRGFTDDGLKPLRRCANLQSVTVYETQISERRLRELQSTAPELRFQVNPR